jgi:hypothetical protein
MTEQQEHAIRIRAYQIWEEEGHLDGLHETHWHMAATEFSLTFVSLASEAQAPTKSPRRSKAA